MSATGRDRGRKRESKLSHVTSIKDVEIKDLDCLRRACDRLGLEFREGKKTFNWYGQWVNDYNAADAAYKNGVSVKDYGKCDHAIGVKGSPWLNSPDANQPYEIGLIENKEKPGVWTLAYDFYAGGHGLVAKVGEGCKDLIKWYSVEVARKEAQVFVAQGWNMDEVYNKATGKVQIKLTQSTGGSGGIWG